MDEDSNADSSNAVSILSLAMKKFAYQKSGLLPEFEEDETQLVESEAEEGAAQRTHRFYLLSSA